MKLTKPLTLQESIQDHSSRKTPAGILAEYYVRWGDIKPANIEMMSKSDFPFMYNT